MLFTRKKLRSLSCIMVFTSLEKNIYIRVFIFLVCRVSNSLIHMFNALLRCSQVFESAFCTIIHLVLLRQNWRVSWIFLLYRQRKWDQSFSVHLMMDGRSVYVHWLDIITIWKRNFTYQHNKAKHVLQSRKLAILNVHNNIGGLFTTVKW